MQLAPGRSQPKLTMILSYPPIGARLGSGDAPAHYWIRSTFTMNSEAFSSSAKCTPRRARAYQELVAEKCGLNVFNNSPDSVQQDLKRYLNAIQAMGSGVG